MPLESTVSRLPPFCFKDFRRKLIMLKKIVLITLMTGFAVLTACSKSVEYVTWQEEVRLNDNRTIVVTQKKFCDGGPHTGGKFAYCLDREAWLTINLPEISSQPIVWHEHLHPMIVNIDRGRLYIVGIPPTEREYRLYGNPEPIYIGFVWENGQWKRIPFNDIPEPIYDTNMLIEGIPSKGTTLLTLKNKESVEMNGKPEYDADQRHIDPKFNSGYPPMYKPSPSK